MQTTVQHRASRLRLDQRQPIHGEWSPPSDREDPVAILAAQGAGRLAEFLPLRTERMRASAFAYLRGSAAVMAADLATQPQSGLTVQLCGDAHLANFGSYASPEGTPVFDVNDFDETFPGPFEWDLKRLATSLVLSGREAGFSNRDCRSLAARSARHYRKHMTRLSGLSPLAAWQSTIDLRAAIAAIDHHRLRRRLEKRLQHSLQASLAHYDLVDTVDGRLVIRERGTTRHRPEYAATIDAALQAYTSSLLPHYADLVGRYQLVDRAMKVVGIGSVGTFCAIGLFASAGGAPLLLQVKQAQTSVLQRALNAPASAMSAGQRVVTGQRRMQAQTDIFLGWTPGPVDGREFYVRRLKDSRLANIGAAIEADMLPFTAALCGRTLARAHGRTTEAALIARAITDPDDVGGEAFDQAIASFAISYADQTERDFTAFCRAADAGAFSPPGPAYP
jgi:uncharacterized protein (DUF2252 family)